MPNCDYYALDDDYDLVMGFVFSQAGWILWELNSQPDSLPRSFDSIASVREAFRLGDAPAYFQLHAPEMRGEVLHRRIELRRRSVSGATFRYATDGWGLVQFYLGAIKPTGALTPCHTNHFTEKGAYARVFPGSMLGDPTQWDWAAVAHVSGKLIRFIHKNSVGKRGSCPILPSAYAAHVEERLTLVLGPP